MKSLAEIKQEALNAPDRFKHPPAKMYDGMSMREIVRVLIVKARRYKTDPKLMDNTWTELWEGWWQWIDTANKTSELVDSYMYTIREFREINYPLPSEVTDWLIGMIARLPKLDHGSISSESAGFLLALSAALPDHQRLLLTHSDEQVTQPK